MKYGNTTISYLILQVKVRMWGVYDFVAVLTSVSLGSEAMAGHSPTPTLEEQRAEHRPGCHTRSGVATGMLLYRRGCMDR